MNQALVASLRGPLFRPLFLAVIFGVLLSLSHAQTAGTGAISGTINDPSGAVVTGATIKAIDQTTGETRTTASSAEGAFLVPSFRPGTYRVEVSKGGFKMWVSEGVPVQITETVALGVRLELGAPLETVEVSAA